MPHHARTHAETKHALAAEVIRSQGVLHLRVFGTSMIPAIWPGDTVIIKRQNPEELRSGDVVLAERDGSFVVHRVQHVRQEAGQVHFETQGDSVPQPDPVGTREQILGKVIAVQRGGRTVGIKSRRSITERIVGFALSRSTFLLAIWLRLHSLSASAALPIVSAQQSEA